RTLTAGARAAGWGSRYGLPRHQRGVQHALQDARRIEMRLREAHGAVAHPGVLEVHARSLGAAELAARLLDVRAVRLGAARSVLAPTWAAAGPGINARASGGNRRRKADRS